MKQGWEIKKLGDIAKFYRGLTYSKDDEVPSSTNMVLRSNNVDLETNALVYYDMKCLREDLLVDEDKKVKANSILICMSNGSKQHIGKVAYIQDDIDYAFGGFMGLIVPTKDIEGKYLYYLCVSHHFKHFLAGIGNGIGITNLRFSDLSSYCFPVPPIAEQEKIVAELDCLSGIIEKKKQQLKELDNLAQSIFYEMFGDPVENDKGWKTSPLHKVSTLINGRAYKQNELLDSGRYRVLRVGNFFTNGNYYYSDLELEDDKYCDNGDLLFAWSASFGAFIWNEDKVIYHYHIWKVLYDNDLLDIQYYRYLLNTMTAFFMKDVHGIGMVHLTKAGMEQYVLPLPPLALQQEFASKIESIEMQKELIAQSIKETETLFNSRMDYYFN